jgi:hypothetical protein
VRQAPLVVIYAGFRDLNGPFFVNRRVQDSGFQNNAVDNGKHHHGKDEDDYEKVDKRGAFVFFV